MSTPNAEVHEARRADEQAEPRGDAQADDRESAPRALRKEIAAERRELAQDEIANRLFVDDEAARHQRVEGDGKDDRGGGPGEEVATDPRSAGAANGEEPPDRGPEERDERREVDEEDGAVREEPVPHPPVGERVKRELEDGHSEPPVRVDRPVVDLLVGAEEREAAAEAQRAGEHRHCGVAVIRRPREELEHVPAAQGARGAGDDAGEPEGEQGAAYDPERNRPHGGPATSRRGLLA